MCFIRFVLGKIIDPFDAVSNVTPVAVGGTLSACAILIFVVVVLVIR